MLSNITVLDIGLGLCGLVLLKKLLSSKSPAPLPPGPKGLPLLGNILDMPSSEEWLTFKRWGHDYGPITSVTIFGQTLVVVNSTNVALEMLDKKSSNYSERPVLQMGGELVGWKDTLVLTQPGQRFRNYRRFFHQVIGTSSAMKKFIPDTELATKRFLKSVLTKPEEVSDHVRHTAGVIILKISHGYDVREHRDPFVDLADVAVNQFSISTAPGAFLVDLMPILKHVPAWFPGAGFQRKAAEWNDCLERTVNQPHNFVKKQMAEGIAPPSFTHDLLEDKVPTEEEEHEIKWSAASLYTGGADTTVSALHAFFLAMAKYPEVQVKARAELDSIVGFDRLPSFEDREQLPYLDAVAREVVRWHCVTPTGIAHRAAEDDIHEGYFIPKGTLVIPNIWQMLNDPEEYPDPSKFDPERFIVSEGKKVQRDPYDMCFGFGRRICPGRVLADSSIFLMCAMALAVFDISKTVENGVVIDPPHIQTTGTISHQPPFKCTIKPRSAKAVSLINEDH